MIYFNDEHVMIFVSDKPFGLVYIGQTRKPRATLSLLSIGLLIMSSALFMSLASMPQIFMLFGSFSHRLWLELVKFVNEV